LFSLFEKRLEPSPLGAKVTKSFLVGY
jgi:hypothetical protein